MYGLLLTFGLTLMLQGLFRSVRLSGQPYQCRRCCGADGPRLHVPAELPRVGHRGIARRVPATWFMIERTKLGSYLRAATENPTLMQAFGINVPRMVTLTYGFGVGLAAFAGVIAAPIFRSIR